MTAQPSKSRADVASPDRARRVRRVIARCRAELHAGKAVSDAEVIARFPGLMPELAAALATLRQVHAAMATAANDPALPRPLGPFTLLARLGSGGFGTVYRAVHTKTGRVYAVKELKPEHAHDTGRVQRFQTEAKAARALDHPHIVRVRDVGQVGQALCIAMDLIEGQDLAEHTAARPLDGLGALRLLLPIIRACEHAHAKGVIHRDIKPSNILVEAATGTPYLTDFGLARRLDASVQVTTSPRMFGTPGFMAPEQIDGDDAPGAHTDIFSLGATLYFLLTGRPPFPVVRPELIGDGVSPSVAYEAVLKQILWVDPIRPARLAAGLAPDVETICLKCLEKRPADRYASATELAQDCEQFLLGNAISATAPGPLGRVRRRCQRHPALTAAAAIAAGLLTAGAVLTGYFALEARSSEGKAAAATENIQQAQSVADRATQDASQARAGERQAAQREQVARDAERRRQYFTDMRLLPGLWDKGDTPGMAQLLSRYEKESPDDPRGIEWWHWRRVLGSCCKTLQVGLTPTRLAISENGGVVMAATDSRVVVWDADNARELWSKQVIPRGHRSADPTLDSEIVSLAVSPDGRYAAAMLSSGRRNDPRSTLIVWEGAGGHQVLSVENDLRLSGLALAFSPDGEWVVAGSYEGGWVAWNTSNTTLTRSSSPAPRLPQLPAGRRRNAAPEPFTPKPVLQLRFCASHDRNVKTDLDVYTQGSDTTRWTWPSGGELSAQVPIRDRSGAIVPVVEFDPRSFRLQVPNGTFGVSHTQPKTRVLDSRYKVGATAAFDRYAVAACEDHIVRVWWLPENFADPVSDPTEYRGCPAPITCVALSRGGVACGSQGGLVALWDRSMKELPPLDLGEAPVPLPYGDTLSPSHALVASWQAEASTLVVKRRDGTQLLQLPLPRHGSPYAVFSPREQFLAVFSSPRLANPNAHPGETFQLWSLQTRQPVLGPVENWTGFGVTFTADEALMAVAVEGRGAQVFRTASGELAFDVPEPGCRAAAISPSGTLLAVQKRGRLSVWDLQRQQWTVTGDWSELGIHFDEKETCILGLGTAHPRTVDVLDLAAGRVRHYPIGDQLLQEAVLSSDRRRIFAISTSRHLRIYAFDEQNADLLFDCKAINIPSSDEGLRGAVEALEHRWAVLPESNSSLPGD